MSSIPIKAGQTIAFEGDSLTYLRSRPALDQWPWLRITNNHRSWADIVSEWLFVWCPHLNLKFRNCAVGGSTCRDLHARLNDTVMPIKPDWLFLTLGSNDCHHEIPLDEFRNTLMEYAQAVNQWGGKMVFLLLDPPCPGASERRIQSSLARKPYYSILQELQNNENLPVDCLDVGNQILPKAKQLFEQYEGHLVYSDGTHYSHLGAMLIAGEVLRQFGMFQAE